MDTLNGDSVILLPMEAARIAQLLTPYLGEQTLTDHQLSAISLYVDLLLKWNARMNLTAVRDPEQIVERHFGESLFAARHLLTPSSEVSAADIGSGAGFPGIPIGIYAPGIKLTLIESHGKKAIFLREVARALGSTNINIFQARAEDWDGAAELVTLRAVEKFESVLPVAASLVAQGGTLALLIGAKQAKEAATLLPLQATEELPIPGSRERVLKVFKQA
jgi:16S rRNA (guanine527-N7)-methyltransferase